jgi:uncharacterized membrane-anchored protein YhcB (DUF1043 family)
MVFALIFAQVAPGEAGLDLTISNLASSLAAAGAAVVVTYYFLAFLRCHAEAQKSIFQQFRVYQAESQRKFQEQIDQIADRREQELDLYRAQVRRVNENQAVTLREMIETLKTIEQSLSASRQTVAGLEQTLEWLRRAIKAAGSMLPRVEGEDAEHADLLEERPR